MRVAILADIHGNDAAFAAVMAELVSHDALVLLGDFALFGPRPAEAVDRAMALDAISILGNTDQYLIERDNPIINWTRARLGEARLQWLADRPFDHRIDDLLLVHATPTDVEAVLATSSDPFGYYAVTPEESARALLGGAEADLIVNGHIHFASAGRVGAQRVASVGSVGFPFDGDPRAAYAIAEYRAGHWELAHHRVAYDHKAVAAEIRAQDTPLAGPRAERILQARALPFDTERGGG